jgi:class 3 adenylate cyclase
LAPFSVGCSRPTSKLAHGGTMSALPLESRVDVPLLIAFADLTRFAVHSALLSDQELAETMDAFYERVAARIDAAGGKVVKFIGDAALIVFPEDAASRGVEALLSLKEDIDAWFATRKWESRLIVKVHFGRAVAGPFGSATHKQFDVLGKDVNAAAMLDSTGLALSVEAFRKLEPETRKRFKKHTPTVTYIRVEDPHRFRQR